jgi:hypothetical protein
VPEAIVYICSINRKIEIDPSLRCSGSMRTNLTRRIAPRCAARRIQ